MSPLMLIEQLNSIVIRINHYYPHHLHVNMIMIKINPVTHSTSTRKSSLYIPPEFQDSMKIIEGIQFSRPRLDFPIFKGKEMQSWLYRVGLDFFRIDDEARVRIMALYLNDGPLQWYRWSVRKKGQAFLV